MYEEKISMLKERAKQLRMTALTMIYEAQSGHPGGAFSAADIVAALYYSELKIDPKDPKWPDRDRFVLSKGHVCPILYSALGLLGYFPEKELHTLRKEGSILQGHPDMKKCPGIDISTGSLGQGISSVFGLALATANIPNKVAQALVPILHNKTIYLLVLIAFLALVGTLMETLAAIVIIAPILTPIGIQLGCDPLHLGVLFCIVLVIGFITPPFGVNLFTAVSTTNTPYVKVVKGVWPFIIVGFAALFLFAFVPEIITFLPSLT